MFREQEALDQRSVSHAKAQSTKYFDTKPRGSYKSARELPHFSNTTVSEAKENYEVPGVVVWPLLLK